MSAGLSECYDGNPACEYSEENTGPDPWSRTHIICLAHHDEQVAARAVEAETARAVDAWEGLRSAMDVCPPEVVVDKLASSIRAFGHGPLMRGPRLSARIRSFEAARERVVAAGGRW